MGGVRVDAGKDCHPRQGEANFNGGGHRAVAITAFQIVAPSPSGYAGVGKRVSSEKCLLRGRMDMSLRMFFCFVAYLAVVAPHAGMAASVDTKRVPQATLEKLQQQFLMAEALAIIKPSRDRTNSQTYLRSRPERFNFVATQQQQQMTMDGYSVQDPASPIIGYSLFYHGSNGPLVLVDASVNPMQQAVASEVSNLIASSFDMVTTPDGSKLHFLGIYDLDTLRVIKIMIRKADTPLGPEYAIRYGVSKR